ncbi:hypothetical protein OHV05_17165 [Kitasatospora sp. NBC_00070]|uniref:hypothetical protein n=1 Tax=Kitasatospora sp. NBC_00070 TaxID=2975962 RepID=UPI0032466EBC
MGSKDAPPPDVDLSSVPANSITIELSDLPASAEDLRWEKIAESERIQALPGVRRAAEKWGATTLVITGLLATVTTVRGAADLGSLRDFWPGQILAGVFSALSLIAALASVTLAALAAQGTPIRMVASGPRLKEASLYEAGRASQRLRLSRRWALAILPLFMIGMGILAYSPKESAEPPAVQITDSNGIKRCGTQVKSSGSSFVLVNNDGASVEIPQSSVRDIAAVKTCKPSAPAAK